VAVNRSLYNKITMVLLEAVVTLRRQGEARVFCRWYLRSLFVDCRYSHEEIAV
jgi:hypothetical protein